MKRLEELKQRGNACFANGDADGAVRAYQEAIDLITQSSSEGQDELNERLSVLYSNISNVHLTTGRYDDSWKAAQQSLRYDATFIKSWFRYVQARRLAGYPFEAFLAHLRHLRPLLRQQRQNHDLAKQKPLPLTIKPSEVADQLEGPLFDALGLSKVLPHIELKECEGGVGIVAQKALKPNDIIFVEERFMTECADMDLGVQQDLTTGKIVEFFAKQILPDQQTHSPRWTRIAKEFKGCWPRTKNEISAENREVLAESLRAALPEMSDEAFEELFFFAVRCRYNCFHSGFFRACALANHSCRANAAMKYNASDATTTLICVRPIESGEFINVKYLSDAHFLMGLGKRREHLRSWLFWCGCERCLADNDLSATSEQLRCAQCGTFAHLPIPGEFSSKNTIDPIIALERSCAQCGDRLTWTAEALTCLRQMSTSLGELGSYSNYLHMADWLLQKMKRVAEYRLHPEHWIYRILLYFFCVPLTEVIANKFKALLGAGMQGARVEEILSEIGIRRLYLDLVQKTGGCSSVSFSSSSSNCDVVVAAEEVSGGGDALYCLSVLWRLIMPFYPEYEGWALHCAICQLVLFSLLRAEESAAMPISQALSLLKYHGRHLGASHASHWIQAYNQHKLAGLQKAQLKTKQLKTIFQL